MEMNVEIEEEDLYEVLGVSKDATKVEIKKAYHKAALSHHPDKVPEDHRPQAEIKFKSISQAYDILFDDDKRALYDQHGMAAFEKFTGMGGPPDMDDILAQMFGFSMGGGGFPGAAGMGPEGMGNVKRKGADEEKEYEVTLEELYRGKTVKFTSTKSVVCSTCNGTGGKERAKPQACSVCGGKGQVTGLRQIAPGLVTQSSSPCGSCQATGQVFKDKDKCKKCRGKRVVSTKKMLELYIPPGAREGDRIVLAGEADQKPDQEPGDVVFVLTEKGHETFQRAGADLCADVRITLAEALTGFEKVVVTHLDGRGISIKVPQKKGEILRPEQVLKVKGEGMPIKRSEAKGDLYLVVKIDFPEDGWLKDDALIKSIREVLPSPGPAIQTEITDEVEFEKDANLNDFGAGSGDPRGGSEWEDEDDEDHAPQCAQQ